MQAHYNNQLNSIFLHALNKQFTHEFNYNIELAREAKNIVSFLYKCAWLGCREKLSNYTFLRLLHNLYR